MVASRLPWIKFWPEALDHPKFVDLTDAERWTWVVVWGKASQQQNRWIFASVNHVTHVTGRPAKHVKRLISVGLLDEDESGIHVHDAVKWQDRYPSDERPMAPRTGTDGDRKTPSKLRQDSVNAPAMVAESSVNGVATGAQESDKREKEKEIENNPPNPPGETAGKPAPKPAKGARVPITDDEIEALVGKYFDRFGTRQAVRDEIDAALNHQARFKAISEKLYVDTWLRRSLEQRGGSLRLVHSQPARKVIDRTGTEN